MKQCSIHQLGLFMAGKNSYQMPNSHLLIQAAEAGDAAEVVRLLALCDPAETHTLALEAAAWGGHAQCVELLIPGCSTAGCTAALQRALIKKHEHCADLLHPHSDIKQLELALNRYYSNSPYPAGSIQNDRSFADAWLARKQHEVLTAVVGEAYAPHFRKM